MMPSFEDFLICEAYRIRVDSHGTKTKRRKCPPGYKLSPDGKRCMKISSAEHMHRSKGSIRASKKTRSHKSTILRKRKMAMKKRHNMGL